MFHILSSPSGISSISVIANATNFEVTRDFILGRQSRTDTSSTGRTEMGVEQSETKQEENYPTL